MFKTEVQCGSSLQSLSALSSSFLKETMTIRWTWYMSLSIEFQVLSAYIMIKTDASAITISPFLIKLLSSCFQLTIPLSQPGWATRWDTSKILKMDHKSCMTLDSESSTQATHTDSYLFVLPFQPDCWSPVNCLWYHNF